MRRSTLLWTIVLCVVLTTQAHFAFAQKPTMIGTWTGTAAQNEGKSNYTVIMTITSTGAETNYPECGSRRARSLRDRRERMRFCWLATVLSPYWARAPRVSQPSAP